MTQRTLSKITNATWHQGFLGKGHSASAILGDTPYEESDPFIVFMDDRLHLPGGDPVGGAHPHAGFETLTLVLKGNEDEWKTGSFELMTAGKGIVHTEEITTQQDIHILQVWLALPPEKRWAQPFFQRLLPENVPTLKNDLYTISVYSGSSNGLTSPIKNYTPLTLVDFKLNKDAIASQVLPSEYSGLIYVLEGEVYVGKQIIEQGQVGWLNKTSSSAESEIIFHAPNANTHFVLYAAKPHHASIISHGPFIGDSTEDIVRLYQEYRQGEMPHLNNLPESQKFYF